MFSSVDKVTYKASTELTISVGAVVTVTQAFHTIDTNADGASDDLETIAGLVAGTWYTFMAAHTARSIVFKTGSDNIVCNGAADLTMDSTNDIVKGFSPDGTNIFCYLAVQGG